PVKHRANKNLVMILNPAFMKYVHQIWLDKKGKYPSTGFMTLILALHICDEVHVFGFGADRSGSWSHYWEPLKKKGFRTGPHPGQREYVFPHGIRSWWWCRPWYGRSWETMVEKGWRRVEAQQKSSVFHADGL
ncbi:hypothetical protein AMECASPLE_036232, partial [Ameca splendens]